LIGCKVYLIVVSFYIVPVNDQQIDEGYRTFGVSQCQTSPFLKEFQKTDKNDQPATCTAATSAATSTAAATSMASNVSMRGADRPLEHAYVRSMGVAQSSSCSFSTDASVSVTIHHCHLRPGPHSPPIRPLSMSLSLLRQLHFTYADDLSHCRRSACTVKIL